VLGDDQLQISAEAGKGYRLYVAKSQNGM